MCITTPGISRLESHSQRAMILQRSAEQGGVGLTIACAVHESLAVRGYCQSRDTVNVVYGDNRAVHRISYNYSPGFVPERTIADRRFVANNEFSVMRHHNAAEFLTQDIASSRMEQRWDKGRRPHDTILLQIAHFDQAVSPERDS